jgi:plastocyanin
MTRITLSLLLAALVGCGGGDGPTGGGGIASVRMVANSITLFSGQVEQLAATALDGAGQPVSGAGTPTWRSSNTTVVTVNTNGEVTALALGSSDVTASFGSVTGTTRVTVAPVPLTATVSMPGNSFTPFTTFLRRGGTVEFEFPQLPHNVIFTQKAGVPSDIQTTSNVRVTRTFGTVGLFPYDCTLHPGMQGEVQVVQ